VLNTLIDVVQRSMLCRPCYVMFCTVTRAACVSCIAQTASKIEPVVLSCVSWFVRWLRDHSDSIAFTTSQMSIDPSIYQDPEYRRPHKKATNHLLVRPVVGRVKPSTYKLPSSDFTYGRKDQFDEEGVREGK
jgi:hypothetical protein